MRTKYRQGCHSNAYFLWDVLETPILQFYHEIGNDHHFEAILQEKGYTVVDANENATHKIDNKKLKKEVKAIDMKSLNVITDPIDSWQQARTRYEFDTKESGDFTRWRWHEQRWTSDDTTHMTVRI